VIFAAEIEERCLLVFANEDEAIAKCEGIDVEAAIWLFWDADGGPLEPEFTVPNERRWFGVSNGRYRLIKASPEHHADLAEALDEIGFMEPNPFFISLEEVRSRLVKG